MTHSVALVADDKQTLHQLIFILSPLKLTISGVYTELAPNEWQGSPAQLWLVVSQNAATIFEMLTDSTDSPILLADEIPSRLSGNMYQKWCSNLLVKVSENFIDEKAYAEKAHQITHQFRDVWVIAASVGGPEAVKKFFAHINPKLPVAFIYGQHIEPNFAPNLLNIISKSSQLKPYLASNDGCLSAGSVTVLPPDKLTEIDDNGRIQVAETRVWESPYTPNLNQVIDNVAKHFLYRMGVIMFSGMCDDGARSSIRIARQGIPLWAQTPQECVSPSMPESVIQSGLVSFIGDAKVLAEKLNKKYL